MYITTFLFSLLKDCKYSVGGRQHSRSSFRGEDARTHMGFEGIFEVHLCC